MRHNIIFILFLLWLFTPGFAQNEFSSEQELREQADEYLLKEEFAKALPLYSQLLSLYPKDPLYNYLFGICALYGDRRDPQKAIRYLQFARDNLLGEVNVYYYLAEAYHLNYRFEEAIENYNTFKNMAPDRYIRQFDVDRKIAMCRNGLNLLMVVHDLYVLEKNNVYRNDFYRYYHIEDFGGKLLSKPYMLRSSVDKRKSESNFIFFSDTTKTIFFSSYGSNRKTGKDLYYSSKQADGSWSEPRIFSEVINTDYDEDYPFMLPDGKTFYFSSKGHNSMGGYDIFKSTLDPLTYKWTKPVNLDFPINTPFDDILFVADSAQRYAYFSSARASTGDHISVYKVRIDRRPEKIQNLYLTYNKDAEESQQDERYKSSLALLRSMTELEVNSNTGMFLDADLAAFAEKTPEMLAKEKISNIIVEKESAESFADTAFVLASITKNAAHVLDEKKFNAYKLASDKKAAYKAKSKAVADLNKKPETSMDPAEREKLKSLSLEANQLEKEYLIAASIAKKIDYLAVQKNEQADLVLNYAGEIQKLARTNRMKEAEILMEELFNLLRKTDTIPSFPEGVFHDHQQFIVFNETEAIRNFNLAAQLRQEAEQLKTEAKDFRDESENATNATLKQGMIREAINAETESADKERQSGIALAKGKQLQEKADSANQSTNLLDKIISNIEYYDEMKIRTEGGMVATVEPTEKKQEFDKKDIYTGETPVTIMQAPDKSNISDEEAAKIKERIIENCKTQSGHIEKEAVDNRRKEQQAMSIAENKLSISESLMYEAQQLLASLDASSTSEQVGLVTTKANELTGQSVKFAREAVTAYDISKIYALQASKKETASVLATERAGDIASALNENRINDANRIIDELNVIILNQKKEKDVKNLMTEQNLKLIDSLTRITTDQLESTRKITKEVESLKEKKLSLESKATRTGNQKKKLAYKTKADDYENEIIDKQKRVDELQQSNIDLQERMNELRSINSYIPDLTERLEAKDAATNQPIEIADAQKLEDKIIQYRKAHVFSEEYQQKIQLAKTGITEEAATEKPLTMAVQDEIPEDEHEKPALTTEEELFSIAQEQGQGPKYLLVSADKEFSKARFYGKSIQLLLAEIAIYRQKLYNAKGGERDEIKLKIDSLANLVKSLEKKKETANARANVSGKYTPSQEIKELTAGEMAEELDKQAEERFRYLNNIRKQAYKVTDPSEKQRMLDEASEVEKDAMELQKDAYEFHALENTIKYLTNQVALEIEQDKVKGMNMQFPGEAAQLKKDAGYFLELANMYEDSARKSLLFADIIFLLEDAKKARAMALSKQEESLALYRNYQISLAESGTTAANMETSTGNKTTEDAENIFDKETSGEAGSEITGTAEAVASAAGLVYKVQIAALRTQIPLEYFSIDQALSTEYVPETGYYRYMAGSYDNYTRANASKIILRTLGYPDAFVVAYYNGRRIPIGEARRIAEEILSSSSVTETGTEVTSGVASAPLAGIPNVNDIEGVFYTVQIGVYSIPKTISQLFDISPVFYHQMENGNFRYFAGIFNSALAAENAKLVIVNGGISDAFVVAIYKGEKISLDRAALLMAEGVQQPATRELSIPAGSLLSLVEPAINPADIVFRVQVGAFSNEVPVEVVDLLISISNTGIKKYISPQGLNIYTAGAFKSYEEAVTLKNSIVANGIPDAFVVAYAGDRRISVQAAQEALKGD